MGAVRVEGRIGAGLDKRLYAGFTYGVGDSVGVVHVGSHGLLEQDMLARLHGLEREGNVRARRSEDPHGVDVGLLDHLVVVEILLLGSEKAHAGLRALLEEVANGDQLGVGVAHEVGQVVGRGDDAAAYYADLHFAIAGLGHAVVSLGLLCTSYAPLLASCWRR